MQRGPDRTPEFGPEAKRPLYSFPPGKHAGRFPRHNLAMKTWLCLALAAAGALFAQPRTPASRPEVAAIRIFEAWLEEQMAYRGLPGVAVGVVYDQDLVWSKGFGYADLEKKIAVTPRTLFRMASNTKMLTAVAVLQLRDAGKLRLDDPPSKYLPWFRVQPAGADDSPVTIAHLLMHGSGLPREAASPYWTTFQFPASEEIRRTVASQQAAYAPDVRWKYSNLALALAGTIVEAVSGESYADYVQRRIFDPLGMSSSSIDQEREGLGVGYGRRMPDGSRQRMRFMNTQGIGPAAGLTSNVEDMARFVSLQFRKGPAGGRQILSSGTLREMHRVHFLETNWTRGTGLGFQVRRVKDKLYIGHGGSLAGYKTQTTFIVEDKLGVIVLTNGDDSRPETIAERALQTIGEAVVKAAQPEKKPPLWDPAWTRFAGLYRSIWGDLQVVALEDSLAAFDPVSEEFQPEEMSKLVPRGEGVFTLEAKTGGSAIGEAVTFIEGEGRVKAIRIGQTLMERVR